MQTVASFEILHDSFLDASGKALQQFPDFARDPHDLVPLYRAMVLTRRFDAKAVALQRTGRLGTYASSLGQEATSIGVAAAMQPEDILLPTYRESGAMLWRGVTIKELLLYWGGDERGSNFAGPRDDFPFSVTIGTHALHAVGAAYAFKLRREHRAAVAVFGDGATSKGDVYEAINFAGVWRVPVVFVAVDNQWAISMPRSRQSAAGTLAQKAIAGGFEGLQVDGNDIIAVRHAVKQALEKAYAGDGPTLVEALTYRLSDHTTADDAGRYRPAEEVSARWQDDPVARLRAYLVSCEVWGKGDEEALLAALDAEIEAAVADYEATPPPPPEAMFETLYGELPAALAEQRAAVIADAAVADEDA